MVNVRDGGFHFCGDPGVSLEFMGPIVTSSYDICICVKRWMTGNDTSLEIPPIFLCQRIHWIGRRRIKPMNENWNLKHETKINSNSGSFAFFVFMSLLGWFDVAFDLYEMTNFLTLKAETLPVLCVVRFLRTRSDSNRESEDVQEVNLIHCMQIPSLDFCGVV